MQNAADELQNRRSANRSDTLASFRWTVEGPRGGPRWSLGPMPLVGNPTLGPKSGLGGVMGGYSTPLVIDSKLGHESRLNI